MHHEASDRTSLNPIKTKSMFLVARQKLKTTKAISKQMKNKKDSMYDSQRKKIKLVDTMALLLCHKISSSPPVPLLLNTERLQSPRGQDTVPEDPHILFLEKTSTLATAFCHPTSSTALSPTSGKVNWTREGHLLARS